MVVDSLIAEAAKDLKKPPAGEDLIGNITLKVVPGDRIQVVRVWGLRSGSAPLQMFSQLLQSLQSL